MMIQKTNGKPSGFTLMELMVVIAIIVILGALSVGGAAYIMEKAAHKKAEVQIGLLANAIEAYKQDMGVYPGLDVDSPMDGDISEELYDALFYEGYIFTEDPDSWVEGEASKIYVTQLDPRDSKQTLVEHTTRDIPDRGLKILDPWGRPFRYRKGIDAQNPDFDLWSLGKDGQTNEENPSRSEEANRDDVRNF